MQRLELLPRGAFTIATFDFGVISGRFCTWSLKRFCDKTGIKSFSEMVERLGANLYIDDLAAFLLSAVEYTFNKQGVPCNYTVEDAYEWIDDAGGLQSFSVLVNHAFESEEGAKKNEAASPAS